MKAEETRSDLGVIKIHKKVIASVASLAAMEIDGVKGIGGNIRSNIYEFLGKKSVSAIKVDIDNNNEVKIDLPLIIRYGFNLPEVANKVQENVHRALEKMTNLLIKDINISVQSIER